MRAIVITEPGGPEVLQIQEVADPVPGDGEVLIRVKAFGVNHAETHMRKGEWPEATPVSGIEAVGTVVTRPVGQRWPRARRCSTIMGGLGRSRNGSYAEYTVAPASQRGEDRDLARLGGPGRDPGELRHRLARAAAATSSWRPGSRCSSGARPPRSARRR